MTFRIIVWLSMTLSLGYVGLRVLWPTTSMARSALLTNVCLAFGLGIGISSCLSFLCLLVSSNSGTWLFCAEAAMVFLGLFLLRFGRSHEWAARYPYEQHSEVQVLPKLRVFRSLVYAATLLSFAVFLMYSFDARHGEYDGWEIWNMRARFLFRGSHWADGFTNFLDYSHPDYPLLLPASIARSWLYSGIETQITPITIALAFTFGTVALLTFSLWQLRSKSQGLLAGLALVGTPFFIIHGASQYADVPIGFYFLATLVLLNLHGRLEADRRPLVLAGVTAGLAAWTKNEGLLFVGAIVLALAVVSAISIKGWKHCLDRVWPVCLGLLPILAVIVYFKIAVAPPNDMVAGQGLAVTLGRLLTLSRYLETGKAFVEQLFSFGVWHPYANIPILLAFYLLLLGVDLSEWPIGVGVCVATLLLVICAYFITYIVTPRPLQWHLMTSLNRLCLQLWPCFLFTYFLIVRTPETATSGSKKIKPQRFPRVQQRSVEELAAADQARL